MADKSIKISVGGVTKTYGLEKLGTRGGSSGSSGSGSGSASGDSSETNTYILVDEDGNEIPAVFVSEEIVFDATASDIRKGKVAATAEGVTVGTATLP